MQLLGSLIACVALLAPAVTARAVSTVYRVSPGSELSILGQGMGGVTGFLNLEVDEHPVCVMGACFVVHSIPRVNDYQISAPDVGFSGMFVPVPHVFGLPLLLSNLVPSDQFYGEAGLRISLPLRIEIQEQGAQAEVRVVRLEIPYPTLPFDPPADAPIPGPITDPVPGEPPQRFEGEFALIEELLLVPAVVPCEPPNAFCPGDWFVGSLFVQSREQIGIAQLNLERDPIPEPSAVALFLAGLGLVLWAVRAPAQHGP